MENPTHWYEYLLIAIIGIPALFIMLSMAWFVLKVINGIFVFLLDILTFFSRYK